MHAVASHELWSLSFVWSYVHLHNMKFLSQMYIALEAVVPHWKNELEALSCSFCPKRWIFKHSQSEKHTTPGSKRRTCAQNAFRYPSPIYLGIHGCNPLDKMDPLFLLTASDQKLHVWLKENEECDSTLKCGDTLFYDCTQQTNEDCSLQAHLSSVYTACCVLLWDYCI